MLAFVVSTIAFLVATFFLRRYFDDMGIPRTMTRAVVIFVAALLAAYGVAWLIDVVAGTG